MDLSLQPLEEGAQYGAPQRPVSAAGARPGRPTSARYSAPADTSARMRRSSNFDTIEEEDTLGVMSESSGDSCYSSSPLPHGAMEGATDGEERASDYGYDTEGGDPNHSMPQHAQESGQHHSHDHHHHHHQQQQQHAPVLHTRVLDGSSLCGVQGAAAAAWDWAASEPGHPGFAGGIRPWSPTGEEEAPAWGTNSAQQWPAALISSSQRTSGSKHPGAGYSPATVRHPQQHQQQQQQQESMGLHIALCQPSSRPSSGRPASGHPSVQANPGSDQPTAAAAAGGGVSSGPARPRTAAPSGRARPTTAVSRQRPAVSEVLPEAASCMAPEDEQSTPRGSISARSRRGSRSGSQGGVQTEAAAPAQAAAAGRVDDVRHVIQRPYSAGATQALARRLYGNCREAASVRMQLAGGLLLDGASLLGTEPCNEGSGQQQQQQQRQQRQQQQQLVIEPVQGRMASWQQRPSSAGPSTRYGGGFRRTSPAGGLLGPARKLPWPATAQKHIQSSRDQEQEEAESVGAWRPAQQPVEASGWEPAPAAGALAARRSRSTGSDSGGVPPTWPLDVQPGSRQQFRMPLSMPLDPEQVAAGKRQLLQAAQRAALRQSGRRTSGSGKSSLYF